MKTITMYELLGLVKDGKAPKKIKFGNKIYNYETFNIGKGDNYFTAEWEEVKGYRISYNGTYYYLEIRDYKLNDEVEILEEEKKIPEKLNIEDDGNTITLFGEKENEWTILDNVDVIICNKINSIIDYLKSKGE